MSSILTLGSIRIMSERIEEGLHKAVVAADAVIVNDGNLVFVVRKNPPFKGMTCFAGGKVEANETVEECLEREVKEETGLDIYAKKLLGVYSDPGRDPRGRTIAIAYICYCTGKPTAGDDAEFIRTIPLREIHRGFPHLGFDHELILYDALEELGYIKRDEAVTR